MYVINSSLAIAITYIDKKIIPTIPGLCLLFFLFPLSLVHDSPSLYGQEHLDSKVKSCVIVCTTVTHMYVAMCNYRDHKQKIFIVYSSYMRYIIFYICM